VTTTAPEAPARFQWDRLTFASALGYCMLVASLSVGVVLPELRHQFHISGVVAALHGSTFGIGLLVLGLWGVQVIDRAGRRRTLIGATVCVIAGIGLFCSAQAWPLTLTGTVFSGFGAAMIVVVMPGLISDHHGEHRAAAFAAVNGAPGLAAVGYSLIIGAALAAGWSWRLPYLGLTLLFAAILAVVALPVAVPAAERGCAFSVRPLFDQSVAVPWVHIVNAVIAEFSIGIWAVTYLREVGGASHGLAPVLACVFGVMMLVVRMRLSVILQRFGDRTVPLSFLMLGTGAAVMCFAPGLGTKVLGLLLAGLGAAPLYPLTVDRFYTRCADQLDSVALGAYCSLASGVAVTLGPLALGVIADHVGLRRAILIVPVLAALGIATQSSRAVGSLQPEYSSDQ
jgi:predicted MFS family arabinose efflux permease